MLDRSQVLPVALHLSSDYARQELLRVESAELAAFAVARNGSRSRPSLGKERRTGNMGYPSFRTAGVGRG